MGNCASCSIPLDQSVNKISQWLEEKRGYIHNLEKNLEALKTTMEELKAKQGDLSRRLTREEDRGRKRLDTFQVWLTRVDTIEKEVNDILSARHVQFQRLCLCGFCSKNLSSSYRYGKSVVLTLREVDKLKSDVFEEISAESYEVEEHQVPPTIVGQETMLDKAWTHLMKDEVCIMGLYGMGGVGKTTLLTQINNKFSNNRCGFEYVIWVVVSQGLHIEKIQDDIAEKVGLGGDWWNQKEKSQKTDVLFNFLKKKKFVLFLDDIWEKVDLLKIGVPIPKPENKCKVAFTTRSQDVCGCMGVDDPMEVQCLAENEAFDLFKKKIGQKTLDSDPEIPELAKKVSRKCCGLPLALDIIGETMSSKRTAQEWHHAIKVLTSNVATFSDMKDKILPLLKYSYDDIQDEQVQSCLLYCALYPEDYRISIEEIVENWIGEGIIDGSECMEAAEYKGYEIIGSLVRASLLIKQADYFGKEMVYMHDVVREMALWIASDLGIRKEAFIVRARIGLREIPKVKNWSMVRRMSLMENKIDKLGGSPKCMELTTLLMQKGDLRNISSEFFKFMPKLVVLDLSSNDFTNLPEGISELVSLQYLNLSYTCIRHLPKGMQELKKLIHLDLEYTTKLSSIAEISSLHNLKVLKLKGSRFSWDRLDAVKELESLGHLDILTISIRRSQDLEQLLRSHRLSSCTRYLAILDCTSNVESFGISFPDTLDKLRSVYLCRCNISEIKMEKICSFLSLVRLDIDDCGYLRELTFLMFAPHLKVLVVNNAEKIEDVINKEKACEGEESRIVPFTKLTYLYLINLPKLKNIYWSPLPFPCLQKITVISCPNLKKLPLDSTSGKQGDNGLIIKYEQKEWIDGVEWEDEDTKTRFLASCDTINSPIFLLDVN